MPTRSMTVSVTALALAGTLGLHAQTPQTPSPTTSRPTSTDQRTGTTSGSAQSVTVSGCLKAEKDVPGRTSSADRAGMSDDYLLTNVKMGSGSSTSAMGLAPMYEIKGISDAELKKHINHQIEVVGTVENNDSTGSTSATTGGSTTGTSAGSTAGTTSGSTSGTTAPATGSTRPSGTTSVSSGSDLPDLNATSIKMVAATCSTQ